MSKTTMHDIAEKLNISINAVSLALNDREGVSFDLRMQILETAAEMGYPMKKLNTKNTLKNKTLVAMIETNKKNDTYYLHLLDSIKNYAQVFGYRILEEFYHFHHFQVPKLISEHHVTGVIILGKIKTEMLYSIKLYIQEIICVNHNIPYFQINSVIGNDFLGGYTSCEHLIKNGCRNIGFFGEIKSSQNFQLRFDGFHECMTNNFFNYNHIYLINHIEQAVLNNNYAYIQTLLEELKEIPDAFVCVNDRNALLLIKALQYSGYKVPQDIKVIGYDNIQSSQSSKPTLTTLEVSNQQIASKVIKRIHEIIHETTVPETVMLAPKIIERNSTKKNDA